MQLEFALLADGVTQRPDGKLDIYGAGFDTVFTTAVPAIHQRLVLALRILVARHEGEHPHRIDVVLQGADGAEITRAQYQLQPLEQEQREQITAGRHAALGLLLHFENVLFPDFGAYQLAIHWDGTEAREPLRLFVAEPPQAAP